jgi:hypothetical protein
MASMLILLEGCSLAPGSDKVETVVKSAVDAGVFDRKSYNDEEARLLLVLPCDISIGAYYRLTNIIQQEALVMLCSGRKQGDKDISLNDVNS